MSKVLHTRKAVFSGRASPHMVKFVDETQETHFCTFYEISNPLRSDIHATKVEPGTEVVLRYIVTGSRGGWHAGYPE